MIVAYYKTFKNIMYKKIFRLFFLSIMFFYGSNLVYANVVINEVQLLPTNERFVELYNDTSSSVDLTGWYMQRKTVGASSFSSLVSNPNFEGKTLGVGEYFVISRADFGGADVFLGTLTLTESNTIQIKNSNGEVIDKIGWGDADDCGNISCAPNPNEGQSIQRATGGSWVISTPTLGEENKTSSSPAPENTEEEKNEDENIENISTSSSGKTSTPIKKVVKASKIKAEIQVAGLAYVGIPASFQGKVIDIYGQPIMRGRYFWNFGDGDSREVKTIGTDKFDHTYFYPGDYTVTLEYFPDAFAETPEVTEKIIIKVVKAGVSISRVGDEKDFFIEISNDTNFEIDISKWKLVSEFKVFNFPRNTNLASKKKMILSSRLTNFSVLDKNTLKLFDSQGELVFDYMMLFSVAPKVSKSTFETSQNSVSKFVDSYQNFNEENGKEEELEDLSASVFASGALDSRSYLPILVFIIFIASSAGVVYFIRKRKSDSSNGDDFEILKD